MPSARSRALPTLRRAAFLALACCLAATMATVASSASSASSLALIEGTVVSSGADSITIQPQRGAPVTLDVDSATKVSLDGAASRLAAIDDGDAVRAVYDRTTKVAAAIQAESPHAAPVVVAGQVTAVAGDSITIAPRHGSPVTLSTDASTRVVLNGRASTMGALAVGDAAVAIYDGSTLVAAVIQAQSPHHAIAAVEGQVTGVTASMLTVTPQQGAAVTVTVGATAQVFLNGAVSKLSAIATGDSARVIL